MYRQFRLAQMVVMLAIRLKGLTLDDQSALSLWSWLSLGLVLQSNHGISRYHIQRSQRAPFHGFHVASRLNLQGSKGDLYWGWIIFSKVLYIPENFLCCEYNNAPPLSQEDYLSQKWPRRLKNSDPEYLTMHSTHSVSSIGFRRNPKQKHLRDAAAVAASASPKICVG